MPNVTARRLQKTRQSAPWLAAICLALLTQTAHCWERPPEPAAQRYTNHHDLMVFNGDDRQRHSIRTPAEWQIRRNHILAGMQAAMGPLPDRSQLPPLDVAVMETVQEKGFNRIKLSFVSENLPDKQSADRVPCYLLVPEIPNGQRRPAMLALHQTIPMGKDEPAGLGGSDNLPSNFAVEGVRKAEQEAAKVFNLLGAGDRLRVIYPDCPHDFPPDVRRQAYEFIEEVLGKP